MKVKLSLALAMLLVCSLVSADDKKQPPMDPAMMEAMMKAITPGEAHKTLDAFAGTWTTKVSMWMAPGTEPAVSEGTSENRWIMGGRYLEQRFTGNFMGMPFEGLGYTGYDNVRKQYWGTWMDTMATGVMVTTGKYDGKAWSFSGSMADPMTGKDSPVDEKVTVVDADHHTMEMWTSGPDGKMFKMMEIAYSRKK